MKDNIRRRCRIRRLVSAPHPKAIQIGRDQGDDTGDTRERIARHQCWETRETASYLTIIYSMQQSAPVNGQAQIRAFSRWEWCPPGRCRYPQAQMRQTITVARWRYHGDYPLTRRTTPNAQHRRTVSKSNISSISNPLTAKHAKTLSLLRSQIQYSRFAQAAPHPSPRQTRSQHRTRSIGHRAFDDATRPNMTDGHTLKDTRLPLANTII